MPYSLSQNPVPVWAVSEHKHMVIRPEDLPAFMLPTDAELGGSRGENPQFLKSSGRWNTMKNYKQEIEEYIPSKQTTERVDPALLDVYDLNTKWENRMEYEPENANGIFSLDVMEEKLIKNLATNPFFPLFFRGFAATFSIITLGLSCEVFVQSRNYKERWAFHADIAPRGPDSSTIYTIVISCLSIVYSWFMLWDETFGQPLGLRSSHKKIKYVFFDLVLLCLQSGNIAAAFDALIEREWLCPSGRSVRLCGLHKAVVAFILLTLVAHCMSFLVSAFRMIHRAAH